MRRPRDTTAEAHGRQLEALRRMTPEQRLEAAAEMSEGVRRLVEAGVRSRHPEYSAEEVREAVVEALLGPDLSHELQRRRAAAVR